MSIRITSLILLVGLMTSCEAYGQNWGRGRTIQASNNIITESRELSGFDELKICCSISVDLYKSDTYEVEVQAPDNVMSAVRTELMGDRLVIGMENNVNIRGGSRIKVRISMPSLEDVSVSSSSVLKGHDTFTGDELDVKCSSSGTIDLDFEGEEIDVSVNSSGRIELRGKADEVKVNSSSSGSVDAYDLATKSADVNSSSSSVVRISVSDRLEANASSSASIKYRGQPNYVDTDSSSGASIKGGDR
ncbi:MAG: head GIN domain-containing protein [Bacteroidota bacterium]